MDNRKPWIVIDIYLTYFVLTINNERLDKTMSIITDWLTNYAWIYNYKYGRKVRVLERTAYFRCSDKPIYRLPINILRATLGELGANGLVDKTLVEVNNRVNEVTPEEIAFNVNPDHKDRDYQVEYINLLTRSKNDIMLVDLQTGKGKGHVALRSLEILKQKFAILIPAKFIDKWYEELLRTTNIPKERIYIIQGTDSINNVYKHYDEYKNKYDVVIISLRTIAFYISEYENKPHDYVSQTYLKPPQELTKYLGVGPVVCDEVHMEYKTVLNALLYLNFTKVIGLSATLVTTDTRIEYFHNLLFPERVRINHILAKDKYATLVNVAYYIERPQKIKCITKNGYSHIMFEQYVMRNSVLLAQYLHMIYKYVDTKYIEVKKPGEKLLIFAATVDMCKMIATFLKRKYPKLTINTYLQEDSFDNILNSDISVSTVGEDSNLPEFQDLIKYITFLPDINTQGRSSRYTEENIRQAYLARPYPECTFLSFDPNEKVLDKRLSFSCEKHGLFTISTYDFMFNPTRYHVCPKCSQEKYYDKLEDDFYQKLNDIFKGSITFDRSKFVKGSNQIQFICPKHGEQYKSRDTLLRGNGCFQCFNENIYKHTGITYEKFMEIAKERGKDKFIFLKDTMRRYKSPNRKTNGAYTSIVCICPKHGKFVLNDMRGYLTDNRGREVCPGCVKEKRSKPVGTLDTLIAWLEKKYPGRLDYSKTTYNGINAKTTFICKDHGEFIAIPQHMAKSICCPKCAKEGRGISYGESIISGTIDYINSEYNLGLTYIQEYTIPDEPNKFRYDFYIPDLKLLIECDGVQHSKPVKRWGGEEKLAILQANDAKKDMLAEKYGYILARFDYSFRKDQLDRADWFSDSVMNTILDCYITQKIKLETIEERKRLINKVYNKCISKMLDKNSILDLGLDNTEITDDVINIGILNLYKLSNCGKPLAIIDTTTT